MGEETGAGVSAVARQGRESSRPEERPRKSLWSSIRADLGGADHLPLCR